MSKWEQISFRDVVLGDEVKLVHKDGHQKIITKGKVTKRATLGDWFEIDNEESFYPYEFDANETEGSPTKLYRKTKPFQWPNKLGAVVSGENEDGDTIPLVLVTVDDDKDDPYHDWFHPLWGVVNKADVEHFKNLKVLSEGVDVDET